jgi:hypothetical protein
MNIALLAAFSMLVQDIAEAIKIQAQARNHGWLAGFADAVMWLMLFFSMDIAITSRGSERVWAVCLITAANILGQKLGQIIGKRFIKEEV